MDALYAEAERVYRAFLVEEEKIARSSSLITPEFRGLMVTPMAKQFADAFAKANAQGAKMVGGAVEVKYLRRAAVSSEHPTVPTLDVCVDGTSTVTMIDQKVVARGRVLHVFASFVSEGGVLKMEHQQGTLGDDGDKLC